MASKLFEVGDLVWAKMKGFAPWPAQIKEPPRDSMTPKKIKHQDYVYFFGSKNYAWIPKTDITPHSNKMVQSANLKKKSKQLQSAIDEILLLSEKQPKKRKARDVESDNDASTSKKLSPNKRRAADVKAVPLKKRQREMKKSFGKHIDEVDSESKESICAGEHAEDLENESDQLGEISSSSQPKTPRGRKPSNKNLQIKLRANKKDSNYMVLNRISLPHDSYANFVQKYKSEKYRKMYYSGANSKVKKHIGSGNVLFGYSRRKPHPIRPKPPSYIKKPTEMLDILTVGDYVKKKKVVATKKKIGFIGLGAIGRGVVKSLLNTGHDVMVWNRTIERCEPFIAAGARCARTPADVVLASDIIFSCLKNQDVVNTVFHRIDGILQGFARSSEPGKIYAEMTLINKEASEHICENIVELRGAYLEAGFYGTKEMAENGELILSVAGDPEAYQDCESCFRAMSRTMEYTGTDLGNVSNIAIHVLEGKLTAILAETMLVCKKAKVSQSDFFKLLNLSPYFCKLIKDSGEAILSQNYTPKISVSRTLNAMKLMTELGSKRTVRSLIGSHIRRLYAKAEHFNYGSHDMSSVFLINDLPQQRKTSAEEIQSEQVVATAEIS